MGTQSANIGLGENKHGDQARLDEKSINGQNRHVRAGTGEPKYHVDRVVAKSGDGNVMRDGQKEDPQDSLTRQAGIKQGLLRRASLRLTPADVLVERGGLRQSRFTPPPRRGKITEWSRKSRRGLKLAVRGIEGLSHFVTLTYGADFPTDPAVIRNHWERIRKWFTRHGFKGVWRREIQQRGAIHYHVLIGGADAPDETELGRTWRKITGSADPFRGVHISPVRNMEKVSAYLAKVDALAAESVAVGRYWGTFGDAKVAIKAQVIGDTASIAKLVRVARHLERDARHAARLRTRHDSGMWGCVMWGVAKALNKNLARLTELYGLTGRVDASFASADESDAPAPSAHPQPSQHTRVRASGRMGWIMLRAR